MHQDRGFDFRYFGRRRSSAIECDSSREVAAHADRERVRYPTAEAEPHHTDLAGAVRPRFQPSRCRYEVLRHLRAVHLLKGLSALLVVARVTADAGQPV